MAAWEQDEVVKGWQQDEVVTPPAQAKPTEGRLPPSSGMQAIAEPLAAMATGTVGSALGGLAGGVAAAIPGLRQGIGRDVSQAVSGALTYQPRTEGGKAVLGAVATPFEWLAEKADQAGGAVSDATGSPLAGTAVNTAIQGAPLLLGRGARAAGVGQPEAVASVAARAKAKALGSVKDETLAAARAEGYGIPQSETKPSFLGNRLESAGGKDATRQQFEVKNQEITNKIARREAGLAEDQPITEGNLKAVRKEMAEPYREIAALSSRASTALDRLNTYRADAKLDWHEFNRSGSAAAYRKATDLDAKAAMMEKVLEGEARRAGSPELLKEFREARTNIAKNHSVERALNLGSADVDALTLGQMLDHGAKLTGGLETIAKFALSFPRYAREASKVPPPGISKAEALASITLGTIGSATGVGVLPAALPFLSNVARPLAMSRQSPRTYEQSALGQLTSFPRTADALEVFPYLGLGTQQ